MISVSKIKKEEMLEEIKEKLILYFKKGFINPLSFLKIPDIKTNNIHDIIKIHFLLLNETRDYILSLEKNIKNIKNSTNIKNEEYYGKIKGRIDWNKTIESRLMNNYKNKQHFICNNVNKMYNTKENIVLKKLITIFNNIIYKDLGMERFNERDWYKDGEKYSNIISNIYNKNIYIKRINIKGIKITDKMLQDVSKSRNTLYRDSANLLIRYKKLMSLDKKEISKLFSETFIDINDENKIFELYCIFKFLNNILDKENLIYNILDGNEEEMASLENKNYKYKIYHDSLAKDYISLYVSKDEIENVDNEYLKNKIKIMDRKASIYKVLKGTYLKIHIWSGRPDMTIIRYNKLIKNVDKIILGEIKYTNNEEYMFKGLEELLEYIYFIKDKKFKKIKPDYINGVLFVDDIKLKHKEFGNVKILNREDLKKH